MIRHNPVRRYVVKIRPAEGQAVADCRAKLDADVPGVLERGGVRRVGAAVGVRYVERVRWASPFAPPMTGPFELYREMWVTDLEVPAELAERIDPSRVAYPVISWDDEPFGPVL